MGDLVTEQHSFFCQIFALNNLRFLQDKNTKEAHNYSSNSEYLKEAAVACNCLGQKAIKGGVNYRAHTAVSTDFVLPVGVGLTIFLHDKYAQKRSATLNQQIEVLEISFNQTPQH